ncbi:hypothetical protein OG413_00095 [Streptomyces sp. NBC_01433]|uniref:hypothetical protein n=1 Tax=Streptomyces sp. NBC_01433 TaxID=2903864 RepID=UPI0022564553|nr:hypothetical protein [Streptomyces sp. NBC_01433]MCX4673745.1 hypothetical protein [Streptomyces sp. NBC_01433]
MVQKPESDIEPKERRIDLSLPQVAGSAVAAVAAAVLASQLGVYGTIVGAGVMSIVATCGGSVFQHFFRRTGEQIREVTVQVTHPAGRQVTVRTRETMPARQTRATSRPADDATTVLPAVEHDPDRTRALRPGTDGAESLGAEGAHGADADHTRVLGLDPERTRMLRRVPGAGGPESADPARTQLLPQAGGARVPDPGGPDDEFSGATTHGTRLRGWKRPVLAAAVVFAVSMVGITAFELISGNDLSGGRGTTVGSVVRGGDQDSGPADPAPSGSTGQEPDGDGQSPGTGSGTGSTPGTDRGDGQSPDPDTGRSKDPGSTAEPTPTPSGSGGGETTQSPAPPPPTEPGDGGGSAAPEPTGEGGVPGQEQQAPPATGTGGR